MASEDSTGRIQEGEGATYRAPVRRRDRAVECSKYQTSCLFLGEKIESAIYQAEHFWQRFGS